MRRRILLMHLSPAQDVASATSLEHSCRYNSKSYFVDNVRSANLESEY